MGGKFAKHIKKVSIIIPVYNEEYSVVQLLSEVKQTFIDHGNYEVIVVNDGSSDNSLERLKDIASSDKRVKIISFRTNFGQTAAISAGIIYSSGDVIVPIDSDLENDPRDIPKLLEKLDEGYDIVSGWRKNRWQKNFFSRKLPSIIANWIISKITKVKLHDYGCTLKAYRREILNDIHLYGEMHRFIPVYIILRGAHSTEIAVNYRPRKYGKSNYNLTRIFKVILDLINVIFLSRYFTRPLHFFGKIGFYLLFFGFISGGYAVYLKLFKDVSFIITPLPLLTIFFIITSVLFILMGLLAEIIIRVYFETQQKPTFLIKEKINFN